MAGFLFLGTSYGILSSLVYRFPWYFPMITSVCVFAGSMEFVALNLLSGAFSPLHALVMTLMVNARHLFYGLTMLDKYKPVKRRKGYLIFGLCDETFSLNVTLEPPMDVDRNWFMYYITLLDQSYWVTGATLGGIFGSLIHLDVKGLEFVMTALLLVIFLENWMKETKHTSSLLGLGLTALSLAVFGPADNLFVIPAMAAIIAALALLRRPLEGGEAR
ncbi:MAG: AzlC family ABC transporter permease [Clostridia bacterium]|nr:AzlC family ABC transporter permease [Clostridia bacterium]